MGIFLMLLGVSISVVSAVANAQRLRELPTMTRTEADMNPLSVNLLESAGTIMFIIGLGITFL